MALSRTVIANMALSHVGAEHEIADIEDPNDSNAATCLLWYDEALKMALAKFHWSFARRRAALATHSDSPPNEWSFRYRYPSDCVKVRWIENPYSGTVKNPVPYTVEMSDNGAEKTILTNQESAVAIYTFLQRATELYSPHFTLMLSYHLAGFIAYAVTGKRTLRGDMWALADEALTNAPSFDANEGQDEPEREASWHEAR